MSKYPLSVIGLGMISGIAEGAELNAAAMRCDYDGFQQTTFKQPHSIENQIGAPITIDSHGLVKLSYMSKTAVREAIEKLPKNYQGLTVIYCMPEKIPDTFFNTNTALRDIIDNTFKEMPIGKLNTESTVFWHHRCSFVSALQRAQILLHQKKQEYVLIVSLDSLLNNAALKYYGGEVNGDNCRLLSDENSNGFIPGEAATAILLSSPQNRASDVIISGIGEGFEHATINDEAILLGKGLATAINQASHDANVASHDTQFRVSSVSGEEYFFKEAALAQSRTLKQKVPEHPLWHPADNIGEVGAAIGGAIVVMTYYALSNHYAPGNTALCQLSNDNALRGAFIMQYKPLSKGN